MGSKCAHGYMPHSIPRIPRVDFVQVFVLGAGVPERTKAQPLYLDPHRLHELLILDFTSHMSLLSLVTGLLKRRARRIHVLEKCAEPDSGREVALQEHVLQGFAAPLQSGKGHGPWGLCQPCD